MPTAEAIAAFVFVVIIGTVYGMEVFFVSVFAFHKLKGKKRTAIFRRKAAIFIHVLAIIGILCFLYGFFIEPYWIEVKTIQIRTEKLSRTGFRLVQISDLHCGKKPRNEKKLVELVNALKPDVIVFTGDTLMLHTPSALPLFKETMKKLEAGLGKFAVRGNVDVWYLPDLDFFGGTGFEVLDADSRKLQKNSETFYISGLSCEHPSAFRYVLKDVPDDRFSIFLYHYPGLIEDLNGFNVDLYLAGHTHGGQVALPFYGALVTLSESGKKYESGMYTIEDKILYVNRGIGGHAWSVRFFARPEITVFDIMPENNRAD